MHICDCFLIPRYLSLQIYIFILVEVICFVVVFMHFKKNVVTFWNFLWEAWCLCMLQVSFGATNVSLYVWRKVYIWFVRRKLTYTNFFWIKWLTNHLMQSCSISVCLYCFSSWLTVLSIWLNFASHLQVLRIPNHIFGVTGTNFCVLVGENPFTLRNIWLSSMCSPLIFRLMISSRGRSWF